jgi:hypothetical protein
LPADARFASRRESPFVNKKALPLRSEVYEIPHDISNASGEILFSWFIANPNGPTAFTIGIVEADNRQLIFYRWLHFIRSRTWIIGSVDRGCDPNSQEFADTVRLAMQQAHVHFLQTKEEQPMLGGPPSFATRPKSDKLTEAFLQFAFPVLEEREWGDEFHAMNEYRAAFFDRTAHMARGMYESFKARGERDFEFLDFYWKQHAGKSAFINWKPRNGPPVRLERLNFLSWYNCIISEEYLRHGARDFALMWAGATAMVADGLLKEVRADGTYVPFTRVVDFFQRFNLPIFPAKWTDAHLCEIMGIPTEHL